MAVAAGCGSGGGGGGSGAAPPRPADRAPGLEATNEQEVEALLRDVRDVRARCSGGRPLPGSFGMSRFECTGAARRYSVDWQHYGDGRYTIRQNGRVVARGTLTITE